MFLALSGARLLCRIVGEKKCSCCLSRHIKIALQLGAKNPPCKKKDCFVTLSMRCVYFRRTIYWHQVYFFQSTVVTVKSNSLVHLLRSLITVDWGKHISSHAAQRARSHHHLLQTYNYGFPKHHFRKHHGCNDVREPLYGYRCSLVCLETFSTVSNMCTYMFLIILGFGFWLQRQKMNQTWLLLGWNV